MNTNLTDAERAAWGEIARRLGYLHPRHPGQPSPSGVLRRLAQRYRDEPEPTIALIAAALEIEEIAPAAQEA